MPGNNWRCQRGSNHWQKSSSKNKSSRLSIGWSGGESKKIGTFQLYLLRPSLSELTLNQADKAALVSPMLERAERIRVPTCASLYECLFFMITWLDLRTVVLNRLNEDKANLHLPDRLQVSFAAASLSAP